MAKQISIDILKRFVPGIEEWTIKDVEKLQYPGNDDVMKVLETICKKDKSELTDYDYIIIGMAVEILHKSNVTTPRTFGVGN